jgi:HK97 family phage portal protein
MGGEPTDSGEPVSVDSAMQLATVWACVRLISETVATLPLFLYRKGDKDSRTVAVDEPLYTVLHDSPHADFTAVEFWEGVVASLCLWGNAYAEKQYAAGRLIGLEPLRCDLIEVVRDRNGARVYRYHDPKGRRELSEDQVFHVRGFGNGGDVGLSPISFARHSLGTAKAADKTSAKMFANGIRPTGVLEMDQVLKPDQRQMVKDNIVAPLAGSANAGGVFVLEAGMKFHAVTINPHDAEMLASRGFHVEEICRWFRVPPVMVGHGEKQTSWGTGVEQQMIGFLTFALRPYLTRIEQAIRRSLIPPEQRGTLYAEFAVEGLLRADSASRADFYSKALGSGGSPAWMTVDEIRGLENWPAKGGDAAVLPKPTNVAPAAIPAPAPQG